MTVADLIVALQALPQDVQVVMASHVSPDFVAPVAAILDVVAPARDAGWQLCDYDDDGAVTVVRIMGVGEIDDRAERPNPPIN